MSVIQIKSKFLRNIFDQNTYVVAGENDAVIIDAGAEAKDVQKALGGRKVLAVLLTHAHFDHIWNLKDYCENFNAPVYFFDGAEKRVTDKNLNMSKMLTVKFSAEVDKKLVRHYDFDKPLKLNEFEFKIIHTPGHSADSVCILHKKDLFSGDAIFCNGVGRTDLSDSDNDAMKDSLLKIKDLNFENLYPGHYAAAKKSDAEEIIEMFTK